MPIVLDIVHRFKCVAFTNVSVSDLVSIFVTSVSSGWAASCGSLPRPPDKATTTSTLLSGERALPANATISRLAEPTRVPKPFQRSPDATSMPGTSVMHSVKPFAHGLALRYAPILGPR